MENIGVHAHRCVTAWEVEGAAASRKGLTDYPSVGNARIIERVHSSHI